MIFWKPSTEKTPEFSAEKILPLHMDSMWEMFAMALKLSKPVTAVNLTLVDWMLHTPRSWWLNVFLIGAAVV